MTEPTFLFESWRGRYADGPRSISELMSSSWPGARRVWVTSNGSAGSAGFPGDVGTTVRHSLGYFARLLSADVLVANDIISQHLAKGPRVTYVQLWHGTPLKLIGYDERAHAYSGAQAHLKRMARDVAKWDYLVSPSPTCTELFRSAFAYDGTVWETGYPRNDVLSSPTATTVRARVRESLGLPLDAFAVLYAPTWRDDDKDGSGRFQQSVLPDPATLEAALPPGSRLLLRTHKNVTAPVAGHTTPFVVDVSGHPDVAELYLAADALVSDYSSAVFDFAVTRKPIVLFAPDLDRYRDDVRGLYFDYEDWAPGPVTRTVDELAHELCEVAGLADRSRGGVARYEAFLERFCPYEDGRASERVLNRIRSALG